MSDSTIRFSTFPRTEPPPAFLLQVIAIFRKHELAIGTVHLSKGLTSDEVLAILHADLVSVGFAAEGGKRKDQKIERPVFYGENGIPTVRYEIDAYHHTWKCGLEIEAGRAWMGNAVYRDLIQAMVMVQVDYLLLAVPNEYKYLSGGRPTSSNDYFNTRNLADALYGHSRFRLPYNLAVIGY
jgi:hypothetical protein